MSDLDTIVRPRRTVYDVQKHERPTGKKKRRGHGKRPAKFTQPVLDDENKQQLPIEMSPLIQAAIEYGRKTHALGALKTAKTLTNMVTRLKQVGLSHPVILDVITEAELESKRIMGMFDVAYNEEV